jgi:hypothetical protein
METIGPKRLPAHKLAQEIQICYPTEPEWNEVDNETLVMLVEDFVSEPSCATLAIGLLASRGHQRANELAQWLYLHEHADEWLKASAHDVLHPD